MPTIRARSQALVSEHGVQVRRFPDEILEAGAKASIGADRRHPRQTAMR